MPSNASQPGEGGTQGAAGAQWLLLYYVPVSLFSLRMTHSTNKGGKALLVPTPYAFKVSLLDACFRKESPATAETAARRVFDLVKGRGVHFRPPAECVVQNTFIKIRQEERDAPAGFYSSTIAYREWVFYRGRLVVALEVGGMEPPDVQLLSELAAHLQYLGKRGCFWQFTDARPHAGVLPEGFTVSGNGGEPLRPNLYGVSQFLDDFGPPLCRAKDGFERVSSYHSGRISLGRERIVVPTLIPYVRVQATRNFTRYQGPVAELTSHRSDSEEGQ